MVKQSQFSSSAIIAYWRNNLAICWLLYENMSLIEEKKKDKYLSYSMWYSWGISCSLGSWFFFFTTWVNFNLDCSGCPSVVSLPAMALYSLQAIKTPPQSRRIYGSGSPWHWLIVQLYDLGIFHRLSDHPVWLIINRRTGTAIYSHDTTPHHLAVKLSEKNASKVTQNAARRT